MVDCQQQLTCLTLSNYHFAVANMKGRLSLRSSTIEAQYSYSAAPVTILQITLHASSTSRKYSISIHNEDFLLENKNKKECAEKHSFRCK